MDFCDRPRSEEPLALMSLRQAAFEHAPDGVLIFNADQSRVLSSGQIARFFAREDPRGGCRLFPGLLFGSICRTCPETGCIIDCCVRRLIGQRRAVEGVTLIDADRDGGHAPRWYLVKGAPFTLDGEPHGILSFVDVTGSKHREEVLLEKLELDLSTLTMNKSGLLRAANRLLAGSARRGLTLCMVDFDAFKTINDRYGHLMGDEVLMIFSQIARRSIRSQDVIGRYGGEEFVFLFPDASPEEAARILSRIQREIRAHFSGLLDHPVSFSGGLVCVRTGEGEPETGTQLIGRADQLLYRAKQQGKARLVTEEWEYLLL